MQFMSEIPYKKMEAFAVLLAEGVPRIAAYARAGYSAKSRRSKKTSERQDVIDRVKEVADRNARGGSRDLSFIIDTLIDMGLACQAMGTLPSFNAARALFNDAAKWKQALPIPDRGATAQPQPLFQPMTEEEWEAKYACEPIEA